MNTVEFVGTASCRLIDLSNKIIAGQNQLHIKESAPIYLELFEKLFLNYEESLRQEIRIGEIPLFLKTSLEQRSICVDNSYLSAKCILERIQKENSFQSLIAKQEALSKRMAAINEKIKSSEDSSGLGENAADYLKFIERLFILSQENHDKLLERFGDRAAEWQGKIESFEDTYLKAKRMLEKILKPLEQKESEPKSHIQENDE